MVAIRWYRPPTDRAMTTAGLGRGDDRTGKLALLLKHHEALI